MVELRKVFDNVVRFETKLWGQIDDRLRGECGLTLANVNVMLVVDATPDCRVFDIAEALAITVGGTSQAVDRLEQAGRCVRVPHPSDRRSSIVELTPEGVKLLRAAEVVFDAELERVFRSPLRAPDLDRFAKTVEVLRATIDQ